VTGDELRIVDSEHIIESRTIDPNDVLDALDARGQVFAFCSDDASLTPAMKPRPQSASPPSTCDGLRMSCTATASPRGSFDNSELGVTKCPNAELVSKKALPFGRPIATNRPL
jgi:hypothetical protein